MTKSDKYHEDDLHERDVERIKLTIRQLATAITTIPDGDRPQNAETFIGRMAFTMATGISSTEASAVFIATLASYAETSLAYASEAAG